jgi:hypothetical protein
MVAPVPPNSLAVRLLPDKKTSTCSWLRRGCREYTDSGEAIHILRKILIRVSASHGLILKLH